MVQHSIPILAIYIGGYIICVSEEHNKKVLHDCITKGQLIKIDIFILTLSYLVTRKILSQLFFPDSFEGISPFVVQIEHFHPIKVPLFLFLRPWILISSQFKETGNPAEQPLKEATSHRK